MLEQPTVNCPYCDAPITLLVDCSPGDQSYIEDCSVCCQPMRVNIEANGADLLAVTLECEDQ